VTPETLTTYLNDHLAGSVAAIELLDHLREVSRGTEREKLLAALHSEIEEDQAVLQGLLRELGGKESRVRKAAAWLTEKLGEAKLKLDDPGTGELQLLEALESLGLGILGKLALWRALEVAREQVPELRKTDFIRLRSRAQAQHDRVEAERIRVARMAFGL
jgi:hypothetical protein